MGPDNERYICVLATVMVSTCALVRMHNIVACLPCRPTSHPCMPLCRNRTGQNPVQTFKFENNQLEGPLYPLSQTALQSVRPLSISY